LNIYNDPHYIGLKVSKYEKIQKAKGYKFSKANANERKHRCNSRDLKCNAYYESDNEFVVSEGSVHNDACQARAARKINNVNSQPSALLDKAANFTNAKVNIYN